MAGGGASIYINSRIVWWQCFVEFCSNLRVWSRFLVFAAIPIASLFVHRYELAACTAHTPFCCRLIYLWCRFRFLLIGRGNKFTSPRSCYKWRQYTGTKCCSIQMYNTSSRAHICAHSPISRQDICWNISQHIHPCGQTVNCGSRNLASISIPVGKQ